MQSFMVKFVLEHDSSEKNQQICGTLRLELCLKVNIEGRNNNHLSPLKYYGKGKEGRWEVLRYMRPLLNMLAKRAFLTCSNPIADHCSNLGAIFSVQGHNGRRACNA